VVVADVELEPQPLVGAPAEQPLVFLLERHSAERALVTGLGVELELGVAGVCVSPLFAPIAGSLARTLTLSIATNHDRGPPRGSCSKFDRPRGLP